MLSVSFRRANREIRVPIRAASLILILVKRPNPSLHPPSGWVYPVEHAQLTGMDRADLVSKLSFWLASQNLPGDPDTLIDAYLCALYPSFCREEVAPSAKPSKKSEASALSARRMTYLNRIYQNHHKQSMVSPEEMQRRSEACAKCPFLRATPDSCASCGNNSVFLHAAIVKLFPVVGIELPMACCGKYGSDLSIQLRLEDAGDPNAPEGCWRRTRGVSELPLDGAERASVPGEGAGADGAVRELPALQPL